MHQFIDDQVQVKRAIESAIARQETICERWRWWRRRLLGVVAGLSVIVASSILDFAKRRNVTHVQVTGYTESVSIPVKIK